MDGIAGCSRSPCSRRSRAPAPITTYRSLLAGVNARVEREVGEQRPVLEPVDVGGPADLLVFDGTILRAEATFHVTRSATGFEVDAGSIHGLRSAQWRGGVRPCLPGAGDRGGRRSGPGPRSRAVPERRRAAWLAAGRYRLRGGHRLRAAARRGRALRPGRTGGCVRADPPGAVERRARRHAVAVRRGRGRRRGAVGAGDAKGAAGRRRRSARPARRRHRRRLYRRSHRGRPAHPACARQAARCSASCAPMGRRSWPTSRDSA